MEKATAPLSESVRGGDGGLSGTLRVSVSEGFGTWFIARHLHQFARLHPDLTIDLVSTSGFLSPSKRETDLAVLLARPASGQVVSRKLSDYALRLYASPNYLDCSGVPEAPENLRDHRLISAGASIALLPCFIGDFDPRLVKLLPDFGAVRTFWIVTHSDTRQLRRVRAFQNWLVTLASEHRSTLLG